MATLAFSAFGTSWQGVLGLLGGNALTASDVATRLATVGGGSSTTALVVADATGFAVGDKININTGVFSAEGETHTITSITSAVAGGTDGTINVADADAFTAAPSSGDIVNDGPEQIETMLERVEAYIESRLPQRYADMLRRIDGEVLCEYAQDSPTTFTLAMAAADATGTGTAWVNRTNGTVFVWRNLTGKWGDRWGSELGDSEYSVSGQTLTLDVALADTDRLVVQYDYAMAASAAPPSLGRITRYLAAYEVGELVGLGSDPTRSEAVLAYRDRAEEELDRLGEGNQKIPEFEKIVQYEDRARPTGVTSGGLARS